MHQLPIHEALPALRAALAAHPAAVLEAPPGTGKTTVVPLALLEEPWLAGSSIVMLEPRRLAARAAARYMARTLGQNAGQTVGFRVRGESRVGRGTRVEVVTEGILTRRLEHDPGLEGVGLVIFDEFHERSIHADLGLALALQAQAVLRNDLRILVMSATLDGPAVAELLGGAPVVQAQGRVFPVDTRYHPRRADARLEPEVARATRLALAETEGDVLVFLPGAGEIRRIYELLNMTDLPASVQVVPLHGDLPAAAQDAALAPAAPGQRTVVLATNIAQTSLTIPGVRVVIDAGLARVPAFSPGTGMTRLSTVRVSRASAEQRRGRAGRVAAGVCYRLWDAHEDAHLVPHDRPEILSADLAPVALELAAAGVADPGELKWLDPPPAAAMQQARELLVQLGALDDARRITPHGRRLAELGAHPRLGHLMVHGAELGAADLAATVAALLEERDVLRGDGAPPPVDFALRVEAVAGQTAGVRAAGAQVDQAALHRVRELAARWRGALAPSASRGGTGPGPDGPAAAPAAGRVPGISVGILLALAYPDRLARRRAGQRTRYVLRNGQGAELADAAAFPDAEWLVVAETDGRQPESRIYRAAVVAPVEVQAHFDASMVTSEEYAWDAAREAVIATRVTRLGAITVAASAITKLDSAEVAQVLAAELNRRGVAGLPWGDSAQRLRQRMAFLHGLEPGWPDWSDAALSSRVETWLAPLLAGARGLDDIRRADLGGALLGELSWAQRSALDTLAPTHVAVPTGSHIAVDYSDPAAPVLAVRLQELFGLGETPRVAGGRVVLTLHLLSPAHRPLQVTRDLAGFWKDSYRDVRKEMRGRYPRHAWPEDPLRAAPTRRAKPRKG